MSEVWHNGINSDENGNGDNEAMHGRLEGEEAEGRLRFIFED